MHRQIGNAVPIPVAHAIGRELRRSLFQRWKTQREESIVVREDDDDDKDSHPRLLAGPPLNINDAEDEDDIMDMYA